MHVFDLADSELPQPAGVVVLFGPESFLRGEAFAAVQRRLALEGEAKSLDERAAWSDVMDELSSRSLFGGGAPTVAVVNPADDFVKNYRSELEKYVAQSHSGVMVLHVAAWPSNTKLYKLVAAHGLAIDCRPPAGKRKGSLDADRMTRWLQRRATEHHGFQLGAPGAKELLELTGAEIGLMEQELAKLALFAGKRPVSADLVRNVVGGWKKQTVWELIDAAADGNVPEALLQLNRLLQAGESPQAMFGQLSWGLRRFGTAVTIFEIAEQRGKRMRLDDALEQAGFSGFGIKRAKSQLLQLGRPRARRIHSWLLETDLALKGTHSSDSRARWALEHLLIRLGAE